MQTTVDYKSTFFIASRQLTLLTLQSQQQQFQFLIF